MEELLKQIADNTAPKDSFLITLSGKGSRISHAFDPQIIPSRLGGRLRIAFTSLETWYSWPNVNSSNNQLWVKKSGESKEICLTIETGTYGFVALNDEIQRLLKLNQLDNAVKFKGNLSTLKTIMTLEPGCSVNFKKGNTLRSIYGFESKTYLATTKSRRFVSENIVNITPVNTVLVHCSCIGGGSYVNGKLSSVIHTFAPNTEPGCQVLVSSKKYLYQPIATDVIRQIDCWLTDQDFRPVNLQNEDLTVRFHVESI